MLSFFGISVGALRIAGGLAVAVHAWGLLTAPDPGPEHEGGDASTAAPARQDVAFFPLTMPFTTGPGAISVATALGLERPDGPDGVLGFLDGATLTALLIAALVWVLYASADRVLALLGAAGARVVGRLMAFLLLCIAVQMVITGLEDVQGGAPPGRVIAP